MVTISDWDEEIKDISFIFLISLWSLCLCIPVSEPLVIVCLPVLIGRLKVSHVCLMLCQIFSSLVEYFQLFLIVAANFLILLHSSCQSLCNEEEFLPTWGTVSFKSSAH